MELKINTKAIIAAAEKYKAANDALKELFPEAFKKKDFREIKTFEDACEALGIHSLNILFTDDTPDETAYKKLKIIAKAINQDWVPDWNNSNECKWYPYFKMSSGFGFSGTDYRYDYANTFVGSPLCFETEEKARYAGQQFTDIYKQFLTLQ